jgi:hypothetical protein
LGTLGALPGYLVALVIATSAQQTLFFEVDPLRRNGLLVEDDPIALTLKSLLFIEALEARSQRD